MNLREARIKAGKSVRDVMTEMEVSDTAVYYWETGKAFPTGKRLKKLAELYHCTVDELLSERNTG